MSARQDATVRAHANATVRLCAAREEFWRAERRHAGAQGTPDEAPALRSVGEASAELAARTEWLHWIERGTTVRPAADGEWGLAPDAAESKSERSTERPDAPREREVLVAVPGPSGVGRRGLRLATSAAADGRGKRRSERRPTS
jgi:hypothetical protein